MKSINTNYVIQEYQNGRSTNDIGKELGVNPYYTYKILKENNIPIRTKGNYGKVKNNINKVKELYDQGWSANKIAKELNCGKSSVLKMMKHYNMSTAHLSDHRNDPLVNHTQEIINLYEQGKSTCDIAKIYNAAQASVWQLLKNNNIEMNQHIKYDVDLNYFNKIDTNTKAWVLGLFYTDGNNRENGIRIEMTDKDIIKKIKEEFKYNGPIAEKDYKDGIRKIQYGLFLCRTELSEQLTKLGCPPAKTYILQFPASNIISDDLMSAFLLGALDGDGSISKHYISFTGLDTFLFALIYKIKELTGIQFKYYKRKPQFGSAMLCRRNDIIQFLTWLYKGKILFGERKRNLAKLHYGV